VRSRADVKEDIPDYEPAEVPGRPRRGARQGAIFSIFCAGRPLSKGFGLSYGLLLDSRKLIEKLFV